MMMDGGGGGDGGDSISAHQRVEALQAKLVSSQAEYDRLRDKIALGIERETFVYTKQRVARLLHMIVVYGARVTYEKELCSAASADAERAKAEAAELRATVARVSEECDGLRTLLATEQGAAADRESALRASVAALTSERDEAASRLVVASEFEKERFQMLTDLRVLRADKMALEQKVAVYEKERFEMITDLRQLRAEVAAAGASGVGAGGASGVPASPAAAAVDSSAEVELQRLKGEMVRRLTEQEAAMKRHETMLHNLSSKKEHLEDDDGGDGDDGDDSVDFAPMHDANDDAELVGVAQMLGHLKARPRVAARIKEDKPPVRPRKKRPAKRVETDDELDEDFELAPKRRRKKKARRTTTTPAATAKTKGRANGKATPARSVNNDNGSGVGVGVGDDMSEEELRIAFRSALSSTGISLRAWSTSNHADRKFVSHWIRGEKITLYHKKKIFPSARAFVSNPRLIDIPAATNADDARADAAGNSANDGNGAAADVDVTAGAAADVNADVDGGGDIDVNDGDADVDVDDVGAAGVDDAIEQPTVGKESDATAAAPVDDGVSEDDRELIELRAAFRRTLKENRKTQKQWASAQKGVTQRGLQAWLSGRYIDETMTKRITARVKEYMKMNSASLSDDNDDSVAADAADAVDADAAAADADADADGEATTTADVPVKKKRRLRSKKAAPAPLSLVPVPVAIPVDIPVARVVDRTVKPKAARVARPAAHRAPVPSTRALLAKYVGAGGLSTQFKAPKLRKV